MRTILLALSPTVLIACSSPSAPPMERRDLPPTQETKDWEDWDRDGNLARRVSGRPLTGPEIEAIFIGEVLSGCYGNGENFSERLTTQGTVVMTEDNAAVANYAVEDDALCFAYPNQQPACYTVTNFQDGYLFYTQGGYRLVASTVCPIPEDVRGQG